MKFYYLCNKATKNEGKVKLTKINFRKESYATESIRMLTEWIKV